MMDYLQEAAAQGATDLHLEGDGGVYMRRLGSLTYMGRCNRQEVADLATALGAQSQDAPSIVMKEGEKVKDFSCALDGVGRLRVRRYLTQGREGLAIRFLPSQVPEPETLGWPAAIAPLCAARQGLVLVTGATGSGKSTTLAAMIARINATRACHILTYEAPIEYRFENDRAMIHQCAVPEDVPSFAQGAVDALRMDADVVMLGELADRETMRAAMKLAESGHLVLATMHTGSAAEAMGYFINHFPPDEQPLLRHQLAAMLKAVISQRLLVHRSEPRLVAAYEVLLNNTAVARQIREGELAMLNQSLELGRAEGMVLLEESLAAHVRSGALRLEDGLQAANQPQRLRQLLAQG